MGIQHSFLAKPRTQCRKRSDLLDLCCWENTTSTCDPSLNPGFCPSLIDAKVHCDRDWNGDGKYTYSKKKKESILSKIIPTSPWSKRSRFFFTVSNNLNLKYHLPLAITAKKSSLLPFSVSWLFQWKSGLLLCSGLTSEYFAPLSPWAAEKPASVLIQLLQQDCERFLDRFAGSILL